MSSASETEADARPEPDRVALVLRPGRNRELLAEWLDSFPEYEAVVVDPGETLPEYDVCVVHEHALETVGSTLATRKTAADPVHLPHLLLRAPDDARSRDDGDPDWSLVDDVVSLPVDQAALERRLENLLQARRASLRLRERENQYQQLVELTPEGIFLVADGEVIYANTAAIELLQVGAGADLSGQSLTAYVADEDRRALEDALESVEAGETRASFTEIQFETALGRVVPTQVAGVRVTYDGRPVTQLVVRDLTEQRARQRQLDLFGRAIESAAQGITIADAQQDDEPLVYANEAFERITGYGKGDVLGRNCRFLQGENTDEATVARMARAVEEREPISVELLNYRKDGTPFWNHLDIVPVEDDGEVTHLLGLQRDVTARKEREQRVAVLDRVLRHNIRNRTNVIRGYADLLGEVSEKRAREEIQTAAEELLDISEQVRTFRSVVDDEQVERTAVDLAAVLRDAVAGLDDDAAVTVATPESVRVRADRTLPAAIRDLVELAVQTEVPAVEVDVSEDGDGAFLELIDRGGAFDAEELRIVGGAVETPLEHLQGIDLWLIRWAVEKSDGEFTVDTDDGDPLVRLHFLPP